MVMAMTPTSAPATAADRLRTRMRTRDCCSACGFDDAKELRLGANEETRCIGGRRRETHLIEAVPAKLDVLIACLEDDRDAVFIDGVDAPVTRERRTGKRIARASDARLVQFAPGRGIEDLHDAVVVDG